MYLHFFFFTVIILISNTIKLSLITEVISFEIGGSRSIMNTNEL